MLQKDVLEDLQKHIELIKEYNIPVIVEGYKDKKALVSLGIDPKRVFTLFRRALFKVVEDIVYRKEKSVIILTDLDSEGKKLYSRLKRDLCERGVYIDKKFRNFLFKHTSLRQIEGLKNYLERNDLELNSYGKY